MDYGMCCQTVTVYRKTPTEIVRLELPHCFLQWQEDVHFDRLGRQQERKFLLVQPGAEQLVFPGDPFPPFPQETNRHFPAEPP